MRPRNIVDSLLVRKFIEKYMHEIIQNLLFVKTLFFILFI